MKRIVLCALAAGMILAAPAAEAHIPAECAASTQALTWALEGQDETGEHLDLALEHAETIRAGLVKQYARTSDNVRSKALLLFHCIINPPTID